MINNVDDTLVEKLWQDLDEQLPREQVSQVVAEIAGEFQDAKVKVFIPILVRKLALEQLQRELDDKRHPAVNRALADPELRHGQELFTNRRVTNN